MKGSSDNAAFMSGDALFIIHHSGFIIHPVGTYAATTTCYALSNAPIFSKRLLWRLHRRRMVRFYPPCVNAKRGVWFEKRASQPVLSAKKHVWWCVADWASVIATKLEIDPTFSQIDVRVDRLHARIEKNR